jgi:HEPN domain-containing protein
MSATPNEAYGPQAWFLRAASSLARARSGHGVPGILLDDLCFDAQQAAEKALKALLVARGKDFPKTHAIAHLLTLLEQAGVATPDKVKRAATLTAYAVRARYPGGPPVTEADYQAALAIAADVIAWTAVSLVRREAGGLSGPRREP